MSHFVRIIPFVIALSTIASARAKAPPNVLEVVVGNGPFAGTYKLPTSEVICLHAKKEKRYSAAWKKFNAHDAKAIAEAGINVSNPDEAGAKHGEVRIAFGDPDKKPTIYSVDQAALTFVTKGKGAEIMFEGKTNAGVQLRVTAKCLNVEQF